MPQTVRQRIGFIRANLAAANKGLLILASEQKKRDRMSELGMLVSKAIGTHANIGNGVRKAYSTMPKKRLREKSTFMRLLIGMSAEKRGKLCKLRAKYGYPRAIAAAKSTRAQAAK